MTYAMGDVIGGYRIASIEDQSVTFDRDGIQFWLMLGESSGGNQSGPIGGDALAERLAPDTQPLMNEAPDKDQPAGVMAEAKPDKAAPGKQVAGGDSLKSIEIY